MVRAGLPETARVLLAAGQDVQVDAVEVKREDRGVVHDEERRATCVDVVTLRAGAVQFSSDYALVSL